jgi:hypothetical protein
MNNINNTNKFIDNSMLMISEIKGGKSDTNISNLNSKNKI